MSKPRGVEENTILDFATLMTQLDAYPIGNEYSESVLATILKNTGHLINYQKSANGRIVDNRYFLPHPTEEKFVEIEEAVVKQGVEGDAWRKSVRYLKLRCDGHQDQGPFYICCVMRREEAQTGEMENPSPVVQPQDL
jgi:hypothetical protein